MKTNVYHIQLNVSDFLNSSKFYKDLLSYFDYKIIFEDDTTLGLTNATTDFWINKTEKKYLTEIFHRKSTGINHIAFRVSTKTDVDKFNKEFLQSRKIERLYDSPHLFPEYTPNYYAVYFEDPDRIKLEVVFL